MDSPKQFVIFNMENEDYGIDITEIYEINRLKEVLITEVPKAPKFVEGMINLRGEVVPVINLRKRFGLPFKEYDNDTRIIIVKFENKMIGLIVDQVKEVVTLMNEDITPAPDEIRDINNKYVKGIGKKDKAIETILDIKEILNIVEESR